MDFLAYSNFLSNPNDIETGKRYIFPSFYCFYGLKGNKYSIGILVSLNHAQKV